MQNTIGRPKTFNTDEVTLIAMNYFWLHGYDNSSLADLLKAMGIKKSSFYRTFKSKEELFLLTLDLYIKELFKSISALKNDKGVKYTLLSLVKATISDLNNLVNVGDIVIPANVDLAKGCLLTNSGIECFGKYPTLSKKISSQYILFMEFFSNLIEEGKINNEIHNSLSSKAITARYLSIFNGLVVLLQIGVEKDVIDEIFRSIEELLE